VRFPGSRYLVASFYVSILKVLSLAFLSFRFRLVPRTFLPCFSGNPPRHLLFVPSPTFCVVYCFQDPPFPRLNFSYMILVWSDGTRPNQGRVLGSTPEHIPPPPTPKGGYVSLLWALLFCSCRVFAQPFSVAFVFFEKCLDADDYWPSFRVHLFLDDEVRLRVLRLLFMNSILISGSLCHSRSPFVWTLRLSKRFVGVL